jgi:SAM-dependent methyltransferase
VDKTMSEIVVESVRSGYERYGVNDYYSIHCMDYKNPKSEIVNNLIKYLQENYDLGHKILDLCCGSGEVTSSLSDIYDVSGLDPFTYKLYESKTGNSCIKMDFKDLSLGKLNESYDTIICSFALHLCEESYLNNVLWNLSLLSKYLVIITPHKRPDCSGISWEEIGRRKEDRVTMIVYQSKNEGEKK